MFRSKLVRSLPLPTKSAHAFSNAVFAIVESMFLALIIFYARESDISIYKTSVAIGLSLILAAICVPLVTFIIDRRDNLYFGSYYIALILSIFFIAIFNAQFWTIGSFKIGETATITLLAFLSFVIQISLSIYRYCTHSIGARLCFDKNDSRVFGRLKSVSFVIGIFISAILLGLLIDPFDVATIGFVISSIVLICGLVDFFVTYQYLPVIKLKEATKKIATRESLREIYKDFILSFSLRGQVKKFCAFCFSIIFYAMFFVSAYVYMSIFLNIGTLRAAIVIAIGLFACVFGVCIFSRLFKLYSSPKVVKTNFFVSIVWLAIFITFYVMAFVGVEFSYTIIGIIVAILGFLSSINYVTFINVFVNKLQARSAFNLCTIVYIFCFGLVVIIVGIFAGMHQYATSVNSDIGQMVAVIVHSSIAMLMYMVAAILFVIADKDDSYKDNDIKVIKSKRIRTTKRGEVDMDETNAKLVEHEVVE